MLNLFVIKNIDGWDLTCILFSDVINYIQNNYTTSFEVYLYSENYIYVVMRWDLTNLILLNDIKLKIEGNNYISDITSVIYNYPIELNTNMGIIPITSVQGVLFKNEFYN